MRYICFEGSEGVGKTTQINKLYDFLSKNHTVLLTKEPGTPHLPITQELRKFILDSKYEKNPKELVSDLTTLITLSDSNLFTSDSKEWLSIASFLTKTHNKITLEARELILQSVRSIHFHNLIAKSRNYDFVIQDRGILSGMAYGMAGGVDTNFMKWLNDRSTKSSIGKNWNQSYDLIIMLEGNVSKGLKRAQEAKQEFSQGDVIESRGDLFLEKVDSNFKLLKNEFPTKTINVDNRSIEEIFEEIKGLI